jgi:hypothetical protein
LGLKEQLERLKRAARGEEIRIPQRDGTVARFPESAAADAYQNWLERMGAGEDAPAEHPMLAAVRNSTGPEWRSSAYMVEDPDEHVRPVEDLSEQD